jgi:LuxR family transcriptional regulator, maltose regulon positive regulatory protein
MTTLSAQGPPSREQPSRDLLAKLSVPKCAFLISRRWLFDRLAHGADGPLTVVSGPPGWGKTTLVASWIAHDLAPGRIAWLTLDRQDDDEVTFWSSFVQALVLHGVKLPLQLHPFGAAMPRPAFLADLAVALSRSEEPVVLVLDGFEAITHATIQRDLDLLLRSTTSDLRLVLTTRIEPLALLNSNELTLIRTADWMADGQHPPGPSRSVGINRKRHAAGRLEAAPHGAGG